MSVDPQIIITAASAVATALAALLMSVAKQGVANLLQDLFGASSSEKTAPASDSLMARLNEVREEFQRQKRVAMVSRFSSTILTFGQFIIGGLLASSFIQESLTKSGIGIIGLLVLSSSLVRQYYRPDIQAASASSRAAKLKALLRKAEDQFYFLDQGIPEALPRYKVLEMLSEGLAQIEESEVRDLQSSAQEISSQATASESRSIDKPRAT